MITDYASLQSAVSDWMARNDISATVPDCIALAEARLNRELKPVEIDAPLTGTPSSNSISIGSLSMAEPVALFLTTGGGETLLAPAQDGTFPVSSNTGCPARWATDGPDTLIFDRPLDQAHTFRFRFRQRFNLSNTAPTNWLLENHPDVYLAASILWGNAYIQSTAGVASWKILMDEAIPEIRNYIARQKTALLAVDPALSRVGRRWHSWDLR